MITRTVTARCDEPSCDASLEIPPEKTQVFHYVARRGWRVESATGQTFCPEHREKSLP